MCFLVHPAHFTEIKKVCEMLNSESTNIQEEEELKLMTNGEFKRPKVWSSTRMDWEMVERFLENAKYFDIPTSIFS